MKPIRVGCRAKLRGLVVPPPAFWLLMFLLLSGGCASSGVGRPQTRIQRLDAERIALAAVPGAVVAEGELEKEHGLWVWSFDLKTAGSKDVVEIQVDAVTGRIVSRETVNEARQAEELRAK